MPVNFRNLRFLRSAKLDGSPEFGPKLFEALADSQKAQNQLESQVNGNLSGAPSPPPQISALRIAAQDGIFHFSIDHSSNFYRGIQYHIEYASDPNFSNPFPIDLGSAREHRASLGNLTLYARASASYGISPPGPWVYYGGAQPLPVVGGGASGPSLPPQSQGSGTGFAQQGLQGPGQQQWRGPLPPVRG